MSDSTPSTTTDWPERTARVHAGQYCLRRDLVQMDPDALTREILTARPVFHGAAWARHATLMWRLWPDRDDITASLDLFLVELATIFDPARGKPFGAYACGRLGHVLVDEYRRRFGRKMADLNTAAGRWREAHGTDPTAADLGCTRADLVLLGRAYSLTDPLPVIPDIAAL